MINPKNFIQDEFEKIKSDNASKIPSTIKFKDGELYVISEKIANSSHTIKSLKSWRETSQEFFPTQFLVTDKGTRKWAREQLIQKWDRILFFIKHKDDKEPFGHIGLNRYNTKLQSIEIDNVVRGKNAIPTRGMMLQALNSLIDWSFSNLPIKALYLETFLDNKKAVKLYEKTGFTKIKEIPAIKIENGNNVSWKKRQIKKGAQRYYLVMKLTKKEYKKNQKLSEIAYNIRKDILSMSFSAHSAHSGGALSSVEIITALYFGGGAHLPAKNAPNRDRIVFSKGHDVKVLYSALARKGYFPHSWLTTYEQNESLLAGHATRNPKLGIEATSGSLGHGLSIATGIAYALKLKKSRAKVFAILSDGECDEGSTWEAALFAGHHKLSNLTIIVDYNKLQGFGFTKDILDLEPFEEKWKSFAFETFQIDGHNINKILNTLKTKTAKPKVVIAHTIKGFGGIEKYINTVESQYKPPTKEELAEWETNNEKRIR